MATKTEYYRAARSSRRQTLTRLATGAVGLAASTVFPAPFIHAGRERRLTYACNGVTAFPQIAQQAKEDTGIELDFQVHPNEDLLKLAVTQPNSLDLLEIAFDSLPFLIDLNKIRGIDANRLSRLEDVSPVFYAGNEGASPAQADGRSPSDLCHLTAETSGRPTHRNSDWLTAIPVTFNADSLGVLMGQVRPSPTHWKALLDPVFAGQVAITGIASIGIIDAAMALESRGDRSYANKSNMSREDITFTVDRLIRLKKEGHFKGIWRTFPESINLMRDQGVVIQSMWAPAITKLRAVGLDCRMVDLIEGYRGWARGLTFPRNIDQYKRDMAYDLFNWYLEGYPGAVLSRQGYYSSTPRQTRRHLSPAEWDYWYEGKPAREPVHSPQHDIIGSPGETRPGGSMERRITKITCWNSFMREHRYLRREWQRFLRA